LANGWREALRGTLTRPSWAILVYCRMVCQDEMLLKMAVLGLVNLDASPQEMATLLQCYQGGCNIHTGRSCWFVGTASSSSTAVYTVRTICCKGRSLRWPAGIGFKADSADGWAVPDLCSRQWLLRAATLRFYGQRVSVLKTCTAPSSPDQYLPLLLLCVATFCWQWSAAPKTSPTFIGGRSMQYWASFKKQGCKTPSSAPSGVGALAAVAACVWCITLPVDPVVPLFNHSVACW